MVVFDVMNIPLFTLHVVLLLSDALWINDALVLLLSSISRISYACIEWLPGFLFLS